MAHTKISDLKGIVINDKKGIYAKCLDSEFESGVFLERHKLITEFVNDLKAIEIHRVFGEDETLLGTILDKLEKWEEKLK